jgi:hypothetical protein
VRSAGLLKGMFITRNLTQVGYKARNILYDLSRTPFEKKLFLLINNGGKKFSHP